MYCWNCGKEIPDTSRFCPYCGVERDKLTEVSATATAVAEASATASVEAAASAPTESAVAEVGAVVTPAEVAPVAVAPAEVVETAVATPAAPSAEPVAAVLGTPPAERFTLTTQQPFAPPAQPAYGQQPYPQAAFAGAAGAAVAGEPAANAGSVVAPPQKRSKLPFIIAAAIVVVLAIGGVAIVATGVLANLVSPKSPVAALYDGTENLFYETSSATVEMRAGAGFTLKWELGSDLAHSKIWGYTGGTGFVLSDDTMYSYVTNGSQTTITEKSSGIISELNSDFKRNYDVDVDYNKIVKNGKLDRAYITQINEAISKADVSGSGIGGMDLGSGGDVDTAKITEILDAFMSAEVNKSEVYGTFMTDIKTDSGGGTTSYEATLDPVAFFDALSDYAGKRGREAGYATAASQIVDVCSLTGSLGEYLSNFGLKFSVKNDILTSLSIDVNTPQATVSLTVSVSDINATKLSSDAALLAILDAPVERGDSGSGLGSGLGSDPGDLLDNIF